MITELDPPPTTAEVRSADAYRAAIRAFGEVAGALSERSDLDDLLHLILRKTCELTSVPRASLYLRDDETGLYRGQVGHAAGHGGDERIKRLVCGVEADRFTREIVETRRPVVVADALRDPRPIKATMRAWSVRSMMGVPMVVRGEVIGIMFLDHRDEVHTFDRVEQEVAAAFAELAGVAILQAQLTGELRARNDTVSRQNEMLRRAAAVDERLTSLVLDGCDLRQIAEAVAELTGKPCAIFDAEDRLLASGRPAALTEDVEITLLDPTVTRHQSVAAELAALDRGRAAVIGPMPNAGVLHRHVVAPVTVRNDRWGRLVIREHGTRFTATDMLVARRAATIVALELSAERRAAAAEWNAQAALATELVRGSRDVEDVERRATFLGIDLRKPRVLCLTTTREGGAALPDAPEVVDALHAVAPDIGAFSVGMAEGVVTIVDVPEGMSGPAAVHELKTHLEAACRRLSVAGDVLVGVSTICRAPGDYARASRQARQVIQCLETFSPAGGAQVLTADDLGAGRLFLASSDAAEADRFAQETLGGLLDEPGADALLGTLECFFEQGRSVRRTAEHLDVHENTIRYRMARIEEITGLTIRTDSDAQLSAQLALLVMRLRGVLPSGAATRA